MCSVAQSCPNVCDPVVCSLPSSFVFGDSPGKNTGMGSHSLLQGIFPTQESNLVLLHGRWILCHCTTWEACRTQPNRFLGACQNLLLEETRVSDSPNENTGVVAPTQHLLQSRRPFPGGGRRRAPGPRWGSPQGNGSAAPGPGG